MDGRATGATRTKGLYLGEWATMADAEKAGVMLAWEDHVRAVLDSQGRGSYTGYGICSWTPRGHGLKKPWWRRCNGGRVH